MCIWFKVDARDRIIVYEEWPRTKFHETPSPSYGVAGYADLIKAIEQGDNFHEHPITNTVWRILDPAFGRSRSASSGRTLQDEFSDYMLAFDCTVDNDVTAGHLAVKQLLDDPPRLFVTPNCQNVIEAFERYVYDEFQRNASELKKKETPREEYKDAMDVVRYLAMTGPRWFDTGPRHGPNGFPRNMGLG